MVIIWLGDTHECPQFGSSPSLTNARASFLVVCHAILVLLWCFTLHSWSNQNFGLAQSQFYGIQAEIPQKYLTACIVEDIQLDAKNYHEQQQLITKIAEWRKPTVIRLLHFSTSQNSFLFLETFSCQRQ